MNTTNTPLQINTALRDTIQWEKNLSADAKAFFEELCVGHLTENWRADTAANCVAELLQRNYVYMDGFPASCPVPGSDRRSLWTRFKNFFGFGKEPT
jgi:hypothetical protein